MKYINNRWGLTLIELLAVIVILGIIAAIAIPAIGNIIEKTKVDAHNANAMMIQNAMRLYEIEHPDTTPTQLIELKDYVELPLIDPCTDEAYPDNTPVPFEVRTSCNSSS